jgi:hypothetical protein
MPYLGNGHVFSCDIITGEFQEAESKVVDTSYKPSFLPISYYNQYFVIKMLI